MRYLLMIGMMHRAKPSILPALPNPIEASVWSLPVDVRHPIDSSTTSSVAQV